MFDPSRRTSGFSLLELMIVVGVIGVMAAMVIPDLNRARADADVANAASQLVRLGARARAHTMYTGLAHAIAYLPALGDGQPGVLIARGTSSRCNAVVWNWANAIEVESSSNSISLRTGRASYSAGDIRLVIRPVGLAFPQICTQPNGQTLMRDGDGGVFANTVNGQTDIIFQLFHARTSQPIGMTRQVVFPSGGLPRWVQ